MNYYKTDRGDLDAGEADRRRGLHAQAPAAPGIARSSTSSSPTNARGCGIPAELVYDPVKNPKGARCTMWDTNVATFGRDPATGFARRSLDNVGVQYGLEALNRGVITPAEFLDLNDKIGGFDNDGTSARGAQRRRSGVAAADLRGRPAEFRCRRPRRRRRSCTSAATTIRSATSTIASATSRVRERLRKATAASTTR